MQPTTSLIAEKPRQLPKKLADLINLKFNKRNQSKLAPELFTSAPTLRRAVIDGYASDLLLYRMVKYEDKQFGRQSELIKEANKHFATGVNGLSI